MKSVVAVLGLAMLSPVAAFAESDYSACMKMQARTGSTGFNQTYRGFGSRSTFFPASTYVGAYGGAGSYYYGSNFFYANASSYSFRVDSGFSSAANDYVVALARQCRHLVKPRNPAFRVVALKSPALRTTVNEIRTADAQKSR
jgi:hypothetical protein